MAKAGRISSRQNLWAFLLGLGLLASGWPLMLSAAQSSKPAEKTPAAPVSTETEEQRALEEAFRSAENNPQLIIKNLEAFLDRFPKSSRREVVLRAICSYALEANAPGVLVQYGRMLLEITPDDPKLLSLLIEALARQNDPASRAGAIEYTSRLIKIAEEQRDHAAAGGGSHESKEVWAQRIAGLYAQRAGFYRDSGSLDAARSDDEKSYAIYPTARVAERLGDDALRNGDSARALDYYLTAFIFPEKSPDPAHRQEVRRKLGSLYLAQYHSEKGLGDLMLSRYDALLPQVAGRFSDVEPQNAGRHDPFEFVVERMDGTPLPMSGYRGKVMVLDFWATWCGPCRVQGQLLDQVARSFASNPQVAFLSLNVDEDRSGVPAFLKQAGWTLPVAYAQGLDQLFDVSALPTLVIFDGQSRVVYREDGLIPSTFAEDLGKHLRETLKEAGGSKQ